jgi:hypothetical protein
MNKGDILYLCHPYTSTGSMIENKARNNKIKEDLYKLGYTVISPVDIVPSDMKWGPAMVICRKLLYVCSGLIIASPHWIRSTGCTCEVDWSIVDSRTIYVYDPSPEKHKLGKLVEANENDIETFKYMIKYRQEIIGK